MEYLKSIFVNVVSGIVILLVFSAILSAYAKNNAPTAKAEPKKPCGCKKRLEDLEKAQAQAQANGTGTVATDTDTATDTATEQPTEADILNLFSSAV